MSLDRLISLNKKLKGLAAPLQTITLEIIDSRASRDFIEDANADQLWSGKRADDSEITPPYRELTRQIKAVKGQPIDRVTLKDTGDFHKSITVKMLADGFEITATDQKTIVLEQKYGIEILGLSDANIDAYKEEILKDALIDKLKAFILGD